MIMVPYSRVRLVFAARKRVSESFFFLNRCFHCRSVAAAFFETRAFETRKAKRPFGKRDSCVPRPYTRIWTGFREKRLVKRQPQGGSNGPDTSVQWMVSDQNYHE